MIESKDPESGEIGTLLVSTGSLLLRQRSHPTQHTGPFLALPLSVQDYYQLLQPSISPPVGKMSTLAEKQITRLFE